MALARSRWACSQPRIRYVDIAMRHRHSQTVTAQALREHLDDGDRSVPAPRATDREAQYLSAALRVALRRPEQQRVGAVDELVRDRILENVVTDRGVESGAGAQLGHPEGVSHHTCVHHPPRIGWNAELEAERHQAHADLR